MIEDIGLISTGAVAPTQFGSGERRDIAFVSQSALVAESSDVCTLRDRTDTRAEATGWAGGVGARGVCVPDDPAPGLSSSVLWSDAGRDDDGGGGRRGMTGEAGVVGRDVVGAGEAEATPLRPARIAGTGAAMATGNGGGAM